MSTTTPRRLTTFMAQRKITKAFHYAELAYCEIEDVLRERPEALPDDLVQSQRDADIHWHRQTKRLLQHIEQEGTR